MDNKVQRRAFIKGAASGALTITVGGFDAFLAARAAHAQAAPFRIFTADEAGTIEALGETLVPGARLAGVAHFVDHQLSLAPDEALLEARILNIRPPFADFYRSAIGAINRVSQARNGLRFAQLTLTWPGAGHPRSRLFTVDGRLPQETYDMIERVRDHLTISRWRFILPMPGRSRRGPAGQAPTCFTSRCRPGWLVAMYVRWNRSVRCSRPWMPG